MYSIGGTVPNERLVSRGPIEPTTRAELAVRPALDVVITDGFWKRWQALNRHETIPATTRQLEERGYLENFRVAAGDMPGGHVGRLYVDSDLYKWLEALAWEQANEPSEGLAGLQDRVTNLIARAQAADGYLNTFVQLGASAGDRYGDLVMGHELFCGGHLILAAIAQARCTGKQALLRVAIRYADHLVSTFAPGGIEVPDGHPLVEMSLVELYRHTGNDAYLQLASFLLDCRGHARLGSGGFSSSYYYDDRPYRELDELSGHAVRGLYLAAGAVDIGVETGDRSLLEAAIRQWDDLISSKTYITGGIGSRWKGESIGAPYELPPDRAHAETCAAQASMALSQRLLLATGEARFAELVERTFYNAFLPALSLDGAAFFYVNPLQLREGDHRYSSHSPQRGRQPWFSTACCPTNVIRTMSSLQHLVATVDADGIQIQQYADAVVGAVVGAGQVRLQMTTGYPWTATTIVRVVECPVGPWRLSLRIPPWVDVAYVAINSEPATSAAPGQYFHVSRAWRPGDRVELVVPVTVRITHPDPRIDAVRGCVAVERGPIVYAFEQGDQPAGVNIEAASLAAGPITERSGEAALDGLPLLNVPARAHLTPTRRVFPYGGKIVSGTRPVTMTAIPYFAWGNRGVRPMRVFIPVD